MSSVFFLKGSAEIQWHDKCPQQRKSCYCDEDLRAVCGSVRLNYITFEACTPQNKQSMLSNESCRWINYIWSFDLYQFSWYWKFCIAHYSSLLIFSLVQTWGHRGNSIVPKRVSQLLVWGPFCGCRALICLPLMLAWFWTRIVGGWRSQSYAITWKESQSRPLLKGWKH